jgi:hypothetical protein
MLLFGQPRTWSPKFDRLTPGVFSLQGTVMTWWVCSYVDERASFELDTSPGICPAEIRIDERTEILAIGEMGSNPGRGGAGQSGTYGGCQSTWGHR